MSAAELLERVRGAGFVAKLVSGAPQLVRVTRGAELPEDLLADLKAQREAVVEHLKRTTCPDCGRGVDAKRICYWCHTRPCVSCSRRTSSALISMCDVCSVAEGKS